MSDTKIAHEEPYKEDVYKKLQMENIYEDFAEFGIKTKIANPRKGKDYTVRFIAPEFVSVCPLTQQPDSAYLMIDYIPDSWLIESKALKFYLRSFSRKALLREDCALTIGEKLVNLLEPHWLRIGSYWYPRGGIPIDVFWQTGEPPKAVWIPEQNVAPYHVR